MSTSFTYYASSCFGQCMPDILQKNIIQAIFLRILMGIIILWDPTKHLIFFPTGKDFSTKIRHSLTKTVLDFLVIIGTHPVKNKIAGSGLLARPHWNCYSQIENLNHEQTHLHNELWKGTVIEIPAILSKSKDSSTFQPLLSGPLLMWNTIDLWSSVNEQIDLWNNVLDVERMQANRANVRKNSTPHHIDGRWV